MKILFVTPAGGIDYLSDCAYHGLVTLGHDVVDSKYQWYLSLPLTNQQKFFLYGRGFTMSGNLQDRSNIDRENLELRISSHEFDLIVYGSITRGNQYIDIVKDAYKKNEVVILNGEDNTDFDDLLLNVGICFKRELLTTKQLPISFAIPEEKILKENIVKTLILANLIPGTLANYIYSNEHDYYMGYAISKFGHTKKKGGWDCMRHYEIAANRCLPYFENYQNCPKTIMTNWPSDLLLEANYMFETRDFTRYDRLANEFFEYCKQNLTTKNLANYILSKAF